MLVASVGHVDHGKTSLVRQLTVVETDGLAEEQRRGLSINLGYAYLPRDEGAPLGFIDVPGHQRVINNMTSGISGIDMGMLVIASADAPMPQTHEHLDVLQLLGIGRLVLVINKIDRVTPKHLAEVRQKIEAQAWSLPAPLRQAVSAWGRHLNCSPKVWNCELTRRGPCTLDRAKPAGKPG